MNQTVHKSLLLIAVFLLPLTAMAQTASWEKSTEAADRAKAEGRVEEAEQLYRQVLKQAERFGEKDPRLSITLIDLALVCNAQGKSEEAEALANRSLLVISKATNSFKSLKPKTSSEDEYKKVEVTVDILDRAAGLFLQNAKYAEAEPPYKLIVSIREEALRKSDKPKGNEYFLGALVQMTTGGHEKLLTAYDHLATLYRAEKKNEDAETLYKKSLGLEDEANAQDKPRYATMLNKLGDLYFDDRKFAEAESLYKRAYTINLKSLGPKSPEIASGFGRLATIYVEQGKNAEAVSFFESALAVYQQANWSDKPETATTLERYASLLKKLGQETKAASLLDRATAIRKGQSHAATRP